MDEALAQEILRQAQAHGEARQGQLQREVQVAFEVVLRQLRDVQTQQAAQQAAASSNEGAALLADDALRARIEEVVRQVLHREGPESDAARGIPSAQQDEAPALGVQLAELQGNIQTLGLPNFTGSDNSEEWGQV